ncbi:MAG: hypothetical protein Q9160_003309 [Pyrenula sp. 1 TL-2023]
MSQGHFGSDDLKTDSQELLSCLITANHILHNHEILDSNGHVSVRNPNNAKSFFLAEGLPSALISKAEHVSEFQVEDGTPVNSAERIEWSERFIHSELYKRFPDVKSVVHSHCADVLPFTVSNVTLRPTTQTAGFLGNSVPVWDIARTYSSGDSSDLLVRTPRSGASLASSYSKSAFSAGTIYNTISSKITGSAPDPTTFPDYPVVLMRGHGFTVAAKGIEEAVYQAVYTKQAARTQSAAMLMEIAHGGGIVEGKVDVEGSGKIKGGKLKAAEDLHYLSAKESADAWNKFSEDMRRPWALWKREVERSPLYENELKSEVK